MTLPRNTTTAVGNRAPCHRCGGDGRIYINEGGRSLGRDRCPKCNGSGMVNVPVQPPHPGYLGHDEF